MAFRHALGVIKQKIVEALASGLLTNLQQGHRIFA
jgi:hypothetical protein